MKKDYQKPEVELVSLLAQEPITSDDDFADGVVGQESNLLG